MSASRSERWRALIVDDEASCRRLISASLCPQFETFEAASGEEALEVFDRVAPDVVLLDLTMPGLDGLEVARRLKRRTQRLVPIFLVTSADQSTTLAAGVGAGVDDFLAKPFDARLFLPRFEVFRRFGEQQQRMIRHNLALETARELALADEVFARIRSRVPADDPRLRVHQTALAKFNGDAVCVATTPSGARRALVVDVTGHGLTAALGTLPIVSLFHLLTASCQPLEATVAVLNRELHAMLPPRLFAAAVAWELAPDGRTLSVVNAGMPSLFVLGRAGVFECSSHAVPLGIVAPHCPPVDRVPVESGDVVFALSDGIIERTAACGTLLGEGRIRELLAGTPREQVFDTVLRLLTAYPCFADDQTLLSFTV